MLIQVGHNLLVHLVAIIIIACWLIKKVLLFPTTIITARKKENPCVSMSYAAASILAVEPVIDRYPIDTLPGHLIAKKIEDIVIFGKECKQPVHTITLTELEFSNLVDWWHNPGVYYSTKKRFKLVWPVFRYRKKVLITQNLESYGAN